MDLQTVFYARMGSPREFSKLFEHVPGVHFFVKDAQSRLIAASPAMLERLGLRDEAEIVGTNDRDYFPEEIADQFVRDDRLVMTSGEPLVNRVEIGYTEQRVLDWYVTTKLPVRDASGKVIGVVGTTQSYEGKRRALVPFSSVSKAVEHLRENLDRRVDATELAQVAGMSARQLTRKFQETFEMTPHEFALKTRIQAASEALARTDAPIIAVALDFGFCDQSAFTVQFRKHMGLTPREFRAKYRSGV
ncbi:MAG: AraC family transcriptional regulator [Verrucomicrobiota bacterium]